MKIKARISFPICLVIFLGTGISVNSTGIHVVRKGDTLWDISGRYRDDPFQWPDIWKLNPSIANPHLIFPGNQVDLGAPSGGRSQQSFKQKISGLKHKGNFYREPSGTGTGVQEGGSSFGFRNMQPEIAWRAPYLSPTGKGEKIYDGEEYLTYKSPFGEDLLQLNARVIINRGRDRDVRTGDLYQVYRVGKRYKSHVGKEIIGPLVTRCGVVRITKVMDAVSEGVLIQCFGKITRDARICPLTKDPEIRVRGYQHYPDNNISGRIIHVESNQNLALPYSYVIIDQGTTMGFKIGDGVLVRSAKATNYSSLEAVVGRGIVVKTTTSSTTIFLKEVFPGKLQKGDIAFAVQSAITS